MDISLNKDPEERSLTDWEALHRDTLRLMASTLNLQITGRAREIAAALFEHYRRDG